MATATPSKTPRVVQVPGEVKPTVTAEAAALATTEASALTTTEVAALTSAQVATLDLSEVSQLANLQSIVNGDGLPEPEPNAADEVNAEVEALRAQLAAANAKNDALAEQNEELTAVARNALLGKKAAAANAAAATAALKQPAEPEQPSRAYKTDKGWIVPETASQPAKKV